MDQHSSDTNLPTALEAKSLEAGLKALWERARRAGELIAQLREERASLRLKVDELEGEVAHLKDEVGQKVELLRKLNTEAAKPSVKNGVLISDGEREQLGARVKELLAKIEGYL